MFDESELAREKRLDNALILDKRGDPEFFASKLAPTKSLNLPALGQAQLATGYWVAMWSEQTTHRPADKRISAHLIQIISN